MSGESCSQPTSMFCMCFGVLNNVVDVGVFFKLNGRFRKYTPIFRHIRIFILSVKIIEFIRFDVLTTCDFPATVRRSGASIVNSIIATARQCNLDKESCHQQTCEQWLLNTSWLMIYGITVPHIKRGFLQSGIGF